MRRELDATRAKLEMLVEASPVVIAELELPARTLRYVSLNVTRLLGYPPEEMVGMPDWAAGLVHPDDMPALREQLAPLFRQESGEARARYRMQRADGVYRWLSVTHRRTVAADGADVILIFLLDVTEEVEGQRREAELTRRLEMMARLDGLEKLAGGVAHEFNNLLAVILNYAAFARDDACGPLDAGDTLPPLLADLEEIRQAAARAAALTQQLTVFGGGSGLSAEPVELDRLLSSVCAGLRISLGDAIEVFYGAAAPCWVMVDREQLEHAIAHLAANAREAMPGGGVLRLELTTDGEHGERACITMSDNGTGMPAGVAERAFEPFFTTKESGTARGLGLCVVHGAVTRAGGQVTLASTPGEGTVVRLSLPTVPAPEVDDTGGDGSGRVRTILVVEDEDAVREVVRRILSQAGFSVLVAAGGDDALAALEERDGVVDLLLVDVVMPHLSGPAVVEQVRARWPGMPALFMSGYPGNALDDGVLAGTACVAKPFTAADLLAGVRAALRP